MQLDFAGAPDVTAPREAVWRLLMDPEGVGAVAPGVEKIERVDDTHFVVTQGFGIGSLKLRFKLDVELFDLTAPERAGMRMRGKAPGSNVDVTTGIRLEALAPRRTRLHWNARADVSGTVASVGARLLEGTARKLTEKFWNDFAKRASKSARR